MNISVLGAGAWGTALAMQAAPRHSVQLWGRDAAQVARMQQERRNERYLPEVEFPSERPLAARRFRPLHSGAR